MGVGCAGDAETSSSAAAAKSAVVSKGVLKGLLGKMASQSGRRGDQRWEEFQKVSGGVLGDLGETVTFDEFALAVFQTMAPTVYHHHHHHQSSSAPTASPSKHFG